MEKVSLQDKKILLKQNHPQRKKIILEAKTWIGTPYQHQASAKGAGCDCLGLIRGVWRAIYGKEPEKIPPYTPQWAESHYPDQNNPKNNLMKNETLANAAKKHLIEINPENILPADVILFRWNENMPAKHAAILSQPQKIIHAYDGMNVTENTFSKWWKRKIAYAFSFPKKIS